MWQLFQALRSEKGQGMTEYGLILALVAIVAIAVLRTLGTNISSKISSVSTTL
jgi:pilus assembly protein Flp/PilA